MSPRYSIIPAGAVTDPRIEARDLQVLCLLGRHIDNLGWCRRSQVRMAKELGCARSTVQASLDRLIAAEWVEKRPEPKGPQGDTAHSYRVRLDHNEDSAFYRDAATLGTGRKRGKPDGQSANADEASARVTPADLSAPPVPPQERHPVPTYASAPVTSPVERDEREGARATGQKQALNLKPIVDGKPEEALEAIERHWPPGAVGNRRKALGLLADMTEADRKAAVDAAPRFLRALKDEKRKYVPAIETYLADGSWERFPPPKASAGGSEPSVSLKPWTRPLWALLARRYEAGKSIVDVSGWLRNGMVLPTLYLPSEDEEKALVPVMPGTPEAAAWAEHLARLGARLPVPDSAPMFLPSLSPKPLSMRWRGYRLIQPVMMEIRSPAWWWRLYAENAPIAELMAERGVGRTEITMGPIPLPAEAESMVRIDVEDETWPAWELWFSARRVRLLPLGGFIYAPARHPNEAFPPARDAVPDYDALEAMGEMR